MVQSQEIKLVFVRSGNNVADIFTKPLPYDVFVRFRDVLLGTRLFTTLED